VRGARWVTTGLVDQVVIATANAANTLLALVLLPRSTAGFVVLAINLTYLVLVTGRAFVGDVLLAKVARVSGRRRVDLIRDGLAAALAVGTVGAVVFLLVWTFWRHPHPNISLAYLVWLVPFLPVLLVHDAGRYSYLARREQDQALIIDLAWVGSQIAAVLLLFLLGLAHRPGPLLATWGVGATVGAVTFMARSGLRPWQGDPLRWVRETRGLSGWFTATAIVGQIQIQAVGFLVSRQLGPAQLAGLRGAQTVILQPTQNLSTAVTALLVPRSSALAAGHQAGRLRRQTVRVALLFAAFSAVMVAVLVPVAHAALAHVAKFRDIAPLALPVGVQAGIYLMQIPFAAALRGLHRGRALFSQYVLFTTASLTGLVYGAGHGLVGAAWGLTAGAAVGFAVMVAWSLVAISRAGRRPSPGPAPRSRARAGADPAAG
jgi:hypothetical protein